MATTLLEVRGLSTSVEEERRPTDWMFAAGLITGLTILAMAVSGYHPYAEDGGLYMAGIKRVLDPTMYPLGTEFVVEHLRFSVFAPVVAGIVRGTGLSVEMVLLLLQFASFWATLFAAWKLAARCYATREVQVGAVGLLALWLTLPVAGTSLMLMDPYVTARSISTPCALLALLGALKFLLPKDNAPNERRKGLALCCASLTVAAMVHPLMAGYALACVLALACVVPSNRRARLGAMAGLCIGGLVMALALHRMSLPENGDYVRVALTRHYWFLSEWQWYELIGLAAPLLILAHDGWKARRKGNEVRTALARMAILTGGIAFVDALMFAHAGSTNHLVARLQPLRIFQIVYFVMILTVGAALTRRILRRSTVRWVATFALLTVVMMVTERQTFPASAHIELPTGMRWSASKNPWVQAFVWIRKNTPRNALLALDADYITKLGEDAQCFRAIAERSALPDYSKDGGEASISPELTEAWVTGQSAQTGLSMETDARRVAALRPLGVSWVVLERNAVTQFACVYSNEAVKVCRLP